jgi:hypothetical protein
VRPGRLHDHNFSPTAVEPRAYVVMEAVMSWTLEPKMTAEA